MSFPPARHMNDYALISRLDPAIDPARSRLDEYEADYGYDPRHLAFNDTEQPTRFICRHLPHRVVARLLDRMLRGSDGGDVEVSVHEAALLAFRYGVTDIENLAGFDPSRHIQAGNPPMLKESWLDRSPLPVDVIVEIGSVILSRSRLSETDRKN